MELPDDAGILPSTSSCYQELGLPLTLQHGARDLLLQGALAFHYLRWGMQQVPHVHDTSWHALP